MPGSDDDKMFTSYNKKLVNNVDMTKRNCNSL